MPKRGDIPAPKALAFCCRGKNLSASKSGFLDSPDIAWCTKNSLRGESNLYRIETCISARKKRQEKKECGYVPPAAPSNSVNNRLFSKRSISLKDCGLDKGVLL
jgi:hypothetical protein